MSAITRRAAKAAEAALINRLADPWLGGRPLAGDPPASSRPVVPAKVGFVQHVDVPGFSALADTAGIDLFLTAQPGAFVHPAGAILYASVLPESAEDAAQLCADLRSCFTIGSSRSFDQDPGFGLTVLSEIGQRALSPGVNDPGTARLVIGLILGIFSQWKTVDVPAAQYPRIHVPSLTVAELLQQALLPLARDGAKDFDIHLAPQEALLALARLSIAYLAHDAAELSDLAL